MTKVFTPIRRWTPDEEMVLAQMLRAGKSSRAIAVRLKRSIASVQNHADQLNAQPALRTKQAKPGR